MDLHVSIIRAAWHLVYTISVIAEIVVQATTPQSFYTQACFAVDYDFATHRCYFFAVNVVQAFAITADTAVPPNTAVAPYPLLLHCITAAGAQQPGSLGLQPSPTVVHITLCELSPV